MAHPPETFFKEGCFIEEWHNTPSDQNMSIARVRVEAQQLTKLHLLLGTTERYVMLAGRARVTVGDKSWEVSAKDVVSIAPGEPQQIHNLGDDDLIFLAICTPRFDEQNYQEC